MKSRKFVLALLVFWMNPSHAQFAVVHDPDGFVNVRSDASSSGKIGHKIENGRVVYSFESTGNWMNVDYEKKGELQNGFVYKDRLKPIPDFAEIPLVSNSDGKVLLQNANFEIEIVQTAFVRKNHKLTYSGDNKDFLTEIDDSAFFGTDGGIPTRQYKSITIEIDGKKISLPAAALANLFETTLHNSRANYDASADTLYIHSMNSDGAGGYDVIWVIEKGVYKNRFVAYGF